MPLKPVNKVSQKPAPPKPKPKPKPIVMKKVQGVHYFRVYYKSIYKMVFVIYKTGGDEDGFIWFENELVKLFDTKGQLFTLLI